MENINFDSSPFMTSTEIKLGMSSSARPSSRVLKPPGGGHSNIFAEPEVSVNAPRPKYNQQNSSNLNACIGSTDPNQAVEKLREEITQAKVETTTATTKNVETKQSPKESENYNNGTFGIGTATAAATSSRGRVPPGGFSSGGFW